MFEKILVPLDGSSLSRRAIPYAVRLARASGGRLVLARSTHAAGPVGGTYPTAEVEAELAAIAAGLEGEGLATSYHTYSGDPAEDIVMASREHDPDLIVMATHHRGEVGRWFYGSVTDRVARATDVPVLVVPGSCEGPWPTAADSCLRLLVPLDGSEFSKQALRTASRLGEGFETELVLFNAVEPVSPFFGSGYSLTELDPEFRTMAAREMLADVAAGLRHQNQQIDVRTAIGQVPRAIADAAVDAHADAVVMATHGLGGMARLVMGSTATVVLSLATVPVLLVRPDAVPGRAGDVGGEQPKDAMAARRESITVTLDPVEQGVVRLALGELLYSASREEHLSGTIHGLLAKLPKPAAVPSPEEAAPAPAGRR